MHSRFAMSALRVAGRRLPRACKFPAVLIESPLQRRWASNTTQDLKAQAQVWNDSKSRWIVANNETEGGLTPES